MILTEHRKLFCKFLSKAFTKVTGIIAVGDFYELEIWKSGKTESEFLENKLNGTSVVTTKDIQQAIECWASRPTWFTSHPSDTQELRRAVSNLKALNFAPSEDELFEVIYERVKDLPAMLGTPKDIRKSAQDFAAKIYNKL